jgi:hypothetical protein
LYEPYATGVMCNVIYMCHVSYDLFVMSYDKKVI